MIQYYLILSYISKNYHYIKLSDNFYIQQYQRYYFNYNFLKLLINYLIIIPLQINFYLFEHNNDSYI